MISQCLLGLLLVGWARGGVIYPSKPSAYSAAVFAQSFTRHEPMIVAQYAAPLAAEFSPVQTQLNPVPAQLSPVQAQFNQVATQLSPVVETYVAQVPSVRQSDPVSAVREYVGYAPSQTKSYYVSQPAEKKSTPKYEYAYLVIDPGTGDRKSQKETRSGGAVSGEYALVQPDGALRRVAYTADDKSGFNAVIRYAPLALAYDPCAAYYSSLNRETTTTTQTPIPALPKECEPAARAALAATNKGNPVNPTSYTEVLIDSQKEPKDIKSQIKSGALVEAITDSVQGLQSIDKGYRTNTPTAYSYTTVSNYESTEPKPATEKQSRDLSLSYDDIIRCAQEVARIKASQAIKDDKSIEKGNIQQRGPAEMEYAVLPAARSAIAYVATPFIFPTKK